MKNTSASHFFRAAGAITLIAMLGASTGCVAEPAPRRTVIVEQTAPPPPPPTTVASAEVIVEAPPPPPQEVITVRPSRRHVWIQGHYRWVNHHYVWEPGHWELPPRAHAVWVAPRWERRGGTYVYVEGFWR